MQFRLVGSPDQCRPIGKIADTEIRSSTMTAVFSGIKIPDSDLTPRKFDTVSRIEAYIAAKR